MNDSTIQAAVSHLRNKTTTLPPNIAAQHQPNLLSFSEFIAQSKDGKMLEKRLPESVRMANRQLRETIVNDETIDYIHSQIPFAGDDAKKAVAVEEIADTIARFTQMGDVLLFAICVRPE